MSIDQIHNIIEKNGFIPLDEYMHICMQSTPESYYRKGTPIGKSGDFITAPEISQLFGELIGVFLNFHLNTLLPDGYQICELGPGLGTLALDYLRALKKNPPTDIFFLESSETLKQKQLSNIPQAKHINQISDLPSLPTIFLANEFFDALPIKAFKCFGAEKSEIVISKNSQGKLVFDYAPAIRNDTGQIRGVYEYSPNSLEICSQIADFIHKAPSIFLTCDYGYETELETITFRGFKDHTITDGLQNPTSEDLTADVNFKSLANIFIQKGLIAYKLLNQQDFLMGMHIETRLHHLLRNVTDSKTKQLLISGTQKLVNPDEMGERFKFLLITPQYYELYPFTTSL